MHFAIDQDPTTVQAKRPEPVEHPPVVEQPKIPPAMLMESSPVKVVGSSRNHEKVEILIQDVYQKDGRVYCLASAPNAESLVKTHAEAHGLVPEQVYPVTAGQEAALRGKRNLYLDIHYLGAGKVTAKDVAGAHQKDLAVQKKYGVNLINYWVDEKEGIVMCLAQAKDSMDLVKTHKEAHGLLPAQVMKVKQGN